MESVKDYLTAYAPYVLILILVLFAHRNTIFTGFDFTDSTLNYHFSLRILDGNIPFVEFFTAVMPITYYIEALFHSIFGVSYAYNKVLGVCLMTVAYIFQFNILNIFYSRLRSFVFTSVSVLVVSLGEPVYFSFTPFAVTLSIIFTFVLIRGLENKKNLPIITGFLSGVLFCSKQSYFFGALFLFLVVSLFIYDDYLYFIQYFIWYLISVIATIIVALLPSVYYGGSAQLLSALTTGAEKKGITSLYSLLSRLYGISHIEYIVFLVILILITSLSCYFLKRVSYIFTVPFILVSIFFLENILNAHFEPLYRNISIYTGSMTEVILYDFPRFISLAYIVYCISTRKIRYKLFIFSLSVFTFTTISQAGWPGRGYQRVLFSSFSAFLVPLLIEQMLSNTSITPKLKYNFSINRIIISATVFLLFAVFTHDIAFPQWENRRDFKANETVTIEPYLSKWKMSTEHASLLNSLIESKNTYCSKNNTMFVFPWAPVLYSISNMHNPTIHDLPYHDWITLEQGKDIVSTLYNKKPCMIVVEQSSLSQNGRESPFPAEGMRYIEKHIKVMLDKYKVTERKRVFNGYYILYVRN